MIEAALEFLRTNWAFVCIAAVFALGAAKWIVDIQNAEKARLEIRKLRQELEKKVELQYLRQLWTKYWNVPIETPIHARYVDSSISR